MGRTHVSQDPATLLPMLSTMAGGSLLKPLSLRIMTAFLLFSALVKAQNVPPSTWRKPNVTIPWEEQRQIAESALDKSISMLQPNGQYNNDTAYIVAGNLYSQMAEFDLVTGGTKYRLRLKDLLGRTSAQLAKLEIEIQWGLSYGYAAARAYAAYHDEEFLKLAEKSWSSGRAYTISQSDVDAGRMAGKTIEIQKECGGSTMTGGTFWNPNSDDPIILTDATAAFLILSALLAEATSNQTYIEAATQSAAFIRNHFYNSGEVFGAIFAGNSTTSCSINTDSYPSHSGLTIEGLAILTSILPTRNADIDTLLEEVVPLSIVNPAWQGADGVIAAGAEKAGDGYMLRGLRTVLARKRTSEDHMNYIRTYMAVQYNAVLDVRADGDIYGSSWVGYPITTFDPVGQINAVTALVAIMALNGPTVTGTNTPQGPPPSSASPPKSKNSTTKEIAGGVVGGIIFLSIIAVAILFLRRRRKTPEKEMAPAPYTVVEAPYRNEKGVTARATAATPTEPSIPQPVPESIPNARPAQPPANSDVGQMDEQVSASDLARLLYARLQQERWRDSEMPPPSYPQSHRPES